MANAEIVTINIFFTLQIPMSNYKNNIINSYKEICISNDKWKYDIYNKLIYGFILTFIKLNINSKLKERREKCESKNINLMTTVWNFLCNEYSAFIPNQIFNEYNIEEKWLFGTKTNISSFSPNLKKLIIALYTDLTP